MGNTLANGQSQKNNTGSYGITGRGLDFDPSKTNAWSEAHVNYQEPGSFGNIGTYSFTNSGPFNISMNVHPISGQIWTNNATLYVYAPDPSEGGAYTVRSFPVGGQGSTDITIPVGAPEGSSSLEQVSFAIVPTSDATEFEKHISTLKALGIATRSPRGIDAAVSNPLYGVELYTTPQNQSRFGAKVEACERALVESRRKLDYGPSERAEYANRKTEMDALIAASAKNPALLDEIGDEHLRKSMQDRVAQWERQNNHASHRQGPQPEAQ